MIDNEILRNDGCDAILPELSAYIDGELEVEAAKHIELHLEKCEKCRKLLSELSSLSEDIGIASIPYPDDLHSHLMGALNEEMSRVRRNSRAKGFGKAIKKHGRWIGAGVAAMICLVLVGSPVFRGSLEFAMNDSKSIEMEDAIVLQNGGIEAAYEMSRTNDEENIYYVADEPGYKAEISGSLTDNILSDDAEVPFTEGEASASGKSDAIDMTDVVEVTTAFKNESVTIEVAYNLLPVFMLPRDELGEIKTEYFH